MLVASKRGSLFAVPLLSGLQRLFKGFRDILGDFALLLLQSLSTPTEWFQIQCTRRPPSPLFRTFAHLDMEKLGYGALFE